MKTYKFSKGDSKWLDEQFDILLNVESDLEYKDAIMSGQWPTAVPILERCLEKAQKVAKERKYENTL
jgi:hypothetical protein